MNDNFYSTKEWHKLRSKTKAVWKRDGLCCGYCNKQIDWCVDKVVVDHVLNRRQHPDLALDHTNLQVVHHRCNTKKAAYVENNNRVATNDEGYPVGSEWSI